jgi:hypothetical protein
MVLPAVTVVGDATKAAVGLTVQVVRIDHCVDIDIIEQDGVSIIGNIHKGKLHGRLTDISSEAYRGALTH